MATTATQPTTVPDPSLPDLSVLAVPAGHALLLKARARGVQIYPCDPNTHTFGAPHPEAILVTDEGEIIHHFKGPTWEAADGSNVVGTPVHKASAPDPNAIPWVLLSTVPGGTPEGTLSNVSFIQRVYTKEGNPPAGKWDPNWSTEIPVFYEAEYYFYAPK